MSEFRAALRGGALQYFFNDPYHLPLVLHVYWQRRVSFDPMTACATAGSQGHTAYFHSFVPIGGVDGKFRAVSSFLVISRRAPATMGRSRACVTAESRRKTKNVVSKH